MRFKEKIIIFLLILILNILVGNIILAQSGAQGEDAKEVTCTDPNTCLKNPLGDGVDIPILAGKIINAVLGIVGSIALVMFIYGGFSWMTAAGNQEAVKKGSNILIWATIGLIIIFSAYALVNFIFKAIE